MAPGVNTGTTAGWKPLTFGNVCGTEYREGPKAGASGGPFGAPAGGVAMDITVGIPTGVLGAPTDPTEPMTAVGTSGGTGVLTDPKEEAAMDPSGGCGNPTDPAGDDGNSTDVTIGATPVAPIAFEACLTSSPDVLATATGPAQLAVCPWRCAVGDSLDAGT